MENTGGKGLCRSTPYPDWRGARSEGEEEGGGVVSAGMALKGGGGGGGGHRKTGRIRKKKNGQRGKSKGVGGSSIRI